MLSVVTHRHEVYLIRIFENTFKMYRHSEGVLDVTGLLPFEGHPCMFALTCRMASSQYSVRLIEQTACARIVKEQEAPFAIDRLFGTVGGSYLIVGGSQGNFVLRLTRNQDYQLYFYLPFGDILAAAGNFVVLAGGLYELDYQGQKCVHLVPEDIVLGRVIDEDIYFLNTEGKLKIWSHYE
jgi:hypothetical protein